MEICNNNIWGTVCDNFWGVADAQVVCRQLGFSAIGKAIFLAELAPPTHLQDLTHFHLTITMSANANVCFF